MTRRRKEPLRTMTEDERTWLERISHATSEPASHVARAKAPLAVADGHTYQAAAEAAGRRSNDAVAQLAARFNHLGVAAIVPRHGGGASPTYTTVERERILAEVRRLPDREQDGTATWSLTTLQRALRRAPDGLPQAAPTPSGGCSMMPASRGNRAGPGARPVRRCASASGALSRSLIRTPKRKKLD